MSGLTLSDLLADTVQKLEEANEAAEVTPENRDAHYDELVFLRVSLGRLRDLCDEIDHRIAETFAFKEKAILGTQTYEAKPRVRRPRPSRLRRGAGEQGDR